MSNDAFKRLQQEWYGRAAATGFRDIESPSGVIARPETRQRFAREALYHQGRERDLEQAAALLATHAFANDFERQVWTLYAGGMSGNKIAVALGRTHGSKRVKGIIRRFKKIAAGAPARKRGRPVEGDSYRQEGMSVRTNLGQAHAMALDRVRGMLRVSAAEALRQGLLELQRRIMRTA